MPESSMVYVTENNKAVILCPECGKLKQISVGKFKDKKHTLKVRCACGKEFGINLNFRTGIRKQIKLKGNYRKASQHPSLKEDCVVSDLSFRGVQLKLHDAQSLKVDDELIISFVLDDTRKTEVKRKIRVCNIIQGDSVGAKFIDPEGDNYDKAIGFYLMNS